MLYDCIIIGAGSAGLTAAMYTTRRDMKTLVISKDLGGQATLTDKIYNYPGIKFMAGLPMMQIFRQQAQEFGAEFVFNEVESVQKTEVGFAVKTTTEEYQAKVVLLCFGLTPRDLGVEGERSYDERVIFHAVTEYGHLYKGKDVAVIGGGNSAFDSVVHLAPMVKRLYLVHRNNTFRGEEITLKKIQALPNVEFILNSQVDGFVGGEKLEVVRLRNKTGELRELAVDGVCVNIGYTTNTKWLGDLVERDKKGHIIISKDCETATEGLYAAGDCTDMPYKQIITSAGDGCKAAMKAYEYLMAKEGKRAIMIDWT